MRKRQDSLVEICLMNIIFEDIESRIRPGKKESSIRHVGWLLVLALNGNILKLKITSLVFKHVVLKRRRFGRLIFQYFI